MGVTVKTETEQDVARVHSLLNAHELNRAASAVRGSGQNEGHIFSTEPQHRPSVDTGVDTQKRRRRSARWQRHPGGGRREHWQDRSADELPAKSVAATIFHDCCLAIRNPP